MAQDANKALFEQLKAANQTNAELVQRFDMLERLLGQRLDAGQDAKDLYQILTEIASIKFNNVAEWKASIAAAASKVSSLNKKELQQLSKSLKQQSKLFTDQHSTIEQTIQSLSSMSSVLLGQTSALRENDSITAQFRDRMKQTNYQAMSVVDALRGGHQVSSQLGSDLADLKFYYENIGDAAMNWEGKTISNAAAMDKVVQSHSQSLILQKRAVDMARELVHEADNLAKLNEKELQVAADKESQILSLTASLEGQYNQLAKLTDQYDSQMRLLDDLESKENRITKNSKLSTQARDKLLNKVKQERKQIESQLTAISDKLKLAEEHYDLTGEQIQLLAQQSEVIRDDVSQREALIQAIQTGKDILEEELSVTMELLGITEEQLQNEEDIEGLVKRKLTAYKRMLPFLNGMEDSADGVADSMRSFFSFLPKGLSDFLGIEKSAQKVAQAGKDAAEAWREAANAGEGFFGQARAAGEAAASSVDGWAALLGGLTVGGAIVLALTKVTQLLLGIDGITSQTAESLQVSAREAKKMVDRQQNMLDGARNSYLTNERINAVYAERIRLTGKLSKANQKGGISQDIATALVEAGAYYRISYGDLSQAQLLLETMAGGSQELASGLLLSTLSAAELNGLSANIITQDLVDGAEAVSLYYAGMPEKAVKAAIATRKMGMSLKQAADVAEGFWDIESSMTKMYELMAMGGEEFDLSKVMEIALTGTPEEMVAALREQFGTIEQFDELIKSRGVMGKFIQKQLADLVSGGDITAFRKMLTTGEEGEVEGAITQGGTQGKVQDIRRKAATYDRGELNEARMDRIMFKFEAAMQDFADKFANVANKLMNSFEDMTDWITNQIRDVADRMAKGESLFSIVVDKALEGVKTVANVVWEGLKTVLDNALVKLEELLRRVLPSWLVRPEGAPPETGGKEKKFEDGKPQVFGVGGLKDFIWRPGMSSPIRFAKDDLIIGATGLESKSKGSIMGNPILEQIENMLTGYNMSAKGGVKQPRSQVIEQVVKIVKPLTPPREETAFDAINIQDAISSYVTARVPQPVQTQQAIQPSVQSVTSSPEFRLRQVEGLLRNLIDIVRSNNTAPVVLQLGDQGKQVITRQVQNVVANTR